MSQLNRLFGVHIGKQAFDKLDHNTPAMISAASPRQNLSHLGTRHASINYPENVDASAAKCQKHGITYCPCSKLQERGQLQNSGSNENLKTVTQTSQKTTPSKPQFTLQPSFGNSSN